MRFGLTDGQPKTPDEIGKVYGVTRERIRQIESTTMSKLRHSPPAPRSSGTTSTDLTDDRQPQDVTSARLVDALNAQIWTASVATGTEPNSGA